MRFAFVLSALLLASGTRVSGSTIAAASLNSTHNYAMAGITQIDGWVQLAGKGGYRWTIPDLEPADVGTTFTLTETNAGDYGFDWPTANSFIQQSAHTNFTFSTGSIINGEDMGASRAFGGPVSFLNAELIDLQFRLVSWGVSSVRVLGVAHYGAPEPSSAVLLSMGLASVFAFRRRS
jgi:hypothetical protein